MDGLKQFKDNYDKDATAAHTMELGVAYLWLQQYENAWAHFRKAITQFPSSMSSFYGMAGTAKWCLGGIDEAIRQWQNGLDCEYADTNGLGVHLPLLLFSGSVLSPGSYETDTAIMLLKEKAKGYRIEDWPGPIARMVLGELSETEIQKECASADLLENQERQWLISFYDGVISYADGERARFVGIMKRLADTCRAEWSNQEFFLSRMWTEEFFLARTEANKP